ncbi:MAG: ribonuclease Z, partial [Flavobacteriales bacterium]
MQSIIDLQISISDTRLRYPLVFHALDTRNHDVIYEDESLRIRTLPMDHRIPCCGFLFEELPRSRNLIKDSLKGLQLENHQYEELKAGKDVQLKDRTLIRSQDVSTPPPAARRYAYCSDTLYQEGLSALVKGVDLLYHEATFLHDKLDRAIETHHSTALQAGMLAKDAEVKELLIGHFSA